MGMKTALSHLLSVTGLAALLCGAPLHAQNQATNQMRVNAVVEDSCTVHAGPLDFGQQFIITLRNLDATAPVILNCTNNTDFVVTIDNGQHFNGQRRLRNATFNRFLRYQVYSDPARTQPWSADVPSGITGNSGNSGVANLTVYGRVPLPILVFPAPYRDTLTVSVHF